MHFSFFKFTLVINSVRLFWKLLVFVSLLGTSRDFPLFYVCPTIKTRPSARCASAANVVCRDFDIVRRQNVYLEHILLQTYCLYVIYLLHSIVYIIFF
jgi:hypothetical protein